MTLNASGKIIGDPEFEQIITALDPATRSLTQLLRSIPDRLAPPPTCADAKSQLPSTSVQFVSPSCVRESYFRPNHLVTMIGNESTATNHPPYRLLGYAPVFGFHRACSIKVSSARLNHRFNAPEMQHSLGSPEQHHTRCEQTMKRLVKREYK